MIGQNPLIDTSMQPGALETQRDSGSHGLGKGLQTTGNVTIENDLCVHMLEGE